MPAKLAIKKLNTSDDFLTPPAIVAAMGEFDLDPCGSTRQTEPLAKRQYKYPHDNGLLLPWEGDVFCNPPFSELSSWIDRFILHGRGVMLVPARVEVGWFWKLWHNCNAIFLTKGPVKYICPEGKAPPVFRRGILRDGRAQCRETAEHPASRSADSFAFNLMKEPRKAVTA